MESNASPWRTRLVAALAATGLTVPLFVTAPALSDTGETPAVPMQEYLLSYAGTDGSVVAAAIAANGGEVKQNFPVADTMLVAAPANTPLPEGAVVVPDTDYSFNNTDGSPTDDVNTHRETTKVPDGVDGSGVTVALIDTGVNDNPDLDVEHVNVSGAEQGDGLGHGTFLAGLIAGAGGEDGEYAGAAPGAKVLDVQVADAEGNTSLTEVLAGMQAVSDRATTDPSLKVVNLALSAKSPLPPWLDPLNRGLNSLWEQGMTVVVASGNDGAGEVHSPANDPRLLAVGSVDENDTAKTKDDEVADFSAYGKSFGVKRPDVTAPGVSLVSLRSPGSNADVENPDARVGDAYFKGTGTSMSAALVSGLTANLVSQRPELTPDDAKRLLMGTANRRGLGKTAGKGTVNLTKALATDVEDTRKLKKAKLPTRHAPSEADEATWADFADAWADGNLRAVVEAWVQLDPATRRWAANAWSLAVMMRGLTLEDADFEGRRWAGRRWATERWQGRRWASDKWVGRRWANINWEGRRWAEENWDGRRWAGRRWAGNDWLAFAWTLNNNPDSDTIKEVWKSEEWEGRRWAGRRWAESDWDGRRWAGRRWAADDWDGRRWANVDWTGRRWAADAWDGRRWASVVWDGRRWAAGDWDGRRWADFTWDGRRWAQENWNGRRWAVTSWGA